MKVWIMSYMLGRRAQSVNNGSPVTVNGRGRLFKSWYRYMKKSEICFIDGQEKSTEFSLHHFSNRAHFDLYTVLVDDL